MTDYKHVSAEQWLEWDRNHIWHPYSSVHSPVTPFAVSSAKGVRLTLADGREVIDGMASWWSAIHGYNHPALNEAAKSQLEAMSHVMFGGLTHQPAATLGKRLVDMTPASLTRVFIADSGSVAVEVAIKMALQYWIGRGRSDKHRLLALRNGYHGDTFATMAICDPVNGMHHLFNKVLPQHLFADAPATPFGETASDQDMASITRLIEQHHHELAAVVLEPIVQGAGGMRFYSADYLRRVRALCDQYDVLLIADEIATGFGRSGKLFACEHAGIEPDILCVGKALTGGYLSLAATLCSEELAATICSGEAGAFMHGPTFMGNPLACAIANASLDVLLSSDWQSQVAAIEQGLRSGLAPAREIPGVADVRCLGAIGVIELQQPVNMATIQPRFVDHGVWLRPFGKLVYTMPPYTISPDDLALLCAKTIAVLSEEHAQHG
ncbi:adenosylmethionine--8-amino-7-oxononanoate transaminase [Spongiibacter sp. KMU-166]|uniref:Adenosylmethionine-8-amino-7-oxononanoate aminotransferase n=1 Tax=Spongiibacter thalassae TaxID=2721624 RepID=A0ABX1GD77_9GAMM|nr:adenosylmethionine--8-amino-7-oxononanoate transaminase [Spongiibacter thalassae]NKI17134.1 adenosylmethionine--8-amino-7-oxononanoate transaminase [Spongiibacter thalassae]